MISCTHLWKESRGKLFHSEVVRVVLMVIHYTAVYLCMTAANEGKFVASAITAGFFFEKHQTSDFHGEAIEVVVVLPQQF